MEHVSNRLLPMLTFQVFDKFIFLICNEIYVLGRVHQNYVNRFRLIFVGGSESDKI